MAKKKSLFARARAAVKKTVQEVRKVAADFIRPDPPPRPSPKKAPTPKRPNLDPEIQEIKDQLGDGDFFRAATSARDVLRRHPNHSAAKDLLARATRDDGPTMPVQLELDKNITDMNPDERDAYLQGMQRQNVLGILKAEGVNAEVLGTIDAVKDWDDHYAFEVHHDGLISDPAEGTASGDRTDVFVGSVHNCARQLAFWSENGEIFSVKITKLGRRVDNWRPLWEQESVVTDDGGLRGTVQGSGKKKHYAKIGRPAKRRGQHTAESSRLARKAESSRKSRARKSNEKRDSILWDKGPSAARRFMKVVENRRRAALNRKAKKKT